MLTLLNEEWSPEEIVGHLRLNHAADPAMRISHETIYRSVYTTRWKVIPRELCKRLRTGRPIRKNKRHTVKGQWRSQITDARPIEQRPQAAEDRSESGHLEGRSGDRLEQQPGRHAGRPEVTVPHGRETRQHSRHTTGFVPALAEAYERMNPRLRSTLTWDRGMELAAHKRFTADTGVDVFFAAPRSPWQRGTNENTNKLLRQYLPKGTNVSTFSQDDLDFIAAKLNNRPRKCLGFRTPAESVALTG